MIFNKEPLIKAMEQGDFQAVDDMLALSIKEDTESIEQLSRDIEMRKFSKAATIAMRASLAVLRMNYDDAIALYAQAISLLPEDHADVIRYNEAMRAAEAAKAEVENG